MTKHRCVWAWIAAACLWGCDGTLDVKVETAPDALHFEITEQDVALPTELQAGNEVARVSCVDESQCPPMLEGAAYDFACVDTLCNPEAIEIIVPVGDVIDFQQINNELGEIAGSIERIRFNFVRYNVVRNDLNVALEGGVDLAWGPPQASGFYAEGVAPLGHIDQWAPGTHDVDLHDQGIDALSFYLTNTSRQIRVFARTHVDVEPGQALPSGAIAIDLQLSLTVTGRVL